MKSRNCRHCKQTVTLSYRRIGTPKFCNKLCYDAYRLAHRVPQRRTRAKCHPDRPHTAHGLCETCYASWHQKQNIEKHRLSSKRHSLKKLYGLELDDFERMAENQDDRCAICREKPEPGFVVDHDHKTKRIRALLCPACNKGLGCFKDSPERLRAAAWYLAIREETPWAKRSA